MSACRNIGIYKKKVCGKFCAVQNFAFGGKHENKTTKISAGVSWVTT